MKQTCKRLFSLLLCMMLVFLLLPTQVLADEAAEPDHLELNDGTLKVSVSTKNGGFLIDTVDGDKLNKSDNNKFLLFPDEDYDTSYTSFRVTRDGKTKDYIFGRNYGFLGITGQSVKVTKQDNSITATWGVEDLIFTQTISLMPQTATQHGMAYISCGVKSTGKAADVKARVMLDTALGYQDYAVYELNQKNSSYRQIQSEQLIDNRDGSAYNTSFFGYDDPKSPSVTAYTLNASVNDKAVTPYQLAFGHWNNLAATVFDFTPDKTLTFTNPNNEKYLTADSAYALYFDMGSVPANGSGKTVATYYGVYSNATVSSEDKTSINFSSIPAAMELNSQKDGYTSQVSGGTAGDFSMTAQIKNVSSQKIDKLAVAFYPQEGLTPYDLNGEHLDSTATFADPHTVQILDMQPGEERAVTVKMNATPPAATDYRKIELRCFDVSKTGGVLKQENQIGSRSVYLLCPGTGAQGLNFLSISPDVIYTHGTRHLYLAGQNFSAIRDTTAYTVKLRPLAGGDDISIPSTNVILDTDKNSTNNTLDLVVDQEMAPGTYQVIFDWSDAGKADTTSSVLRFTVSDDPSYQSGTYGVVTIERTGKNSDSENEFVLKAYRSEEEYKKTVLNPTETTLMEYRGDFNLTYDDNRNLVGAEAVALETVDHKAAGTITISDCLDIENGKLTLSVDDVGTKDQAINTDIDGTVYTSGARTKVWKGVCALTPIENGSMLNIYDSQGLPSDKLADSTANTNAITLLWPGAASTAQTVAGVMLEFRYGQFGLMKTDSSGSTKRRVLSFGAEMSPDFLVPSNFKWGQQQTSAMEKVQLKLASSHYTADQLRDVQERYAKDQAAWEDAEGGGMSLYIHDILFGNGFIGFNTSVEVELPSYAEGLPGIKGTLNLKVMNKEWAFGVEGTADMGCFQLEASLALRSHNGIPIPDKLYFYGGGFYPGINVDGFGVFWIQGAGGGIDHLYETIYPVSAVPPVTLLLSGQFSLFTVLSARADVALSPRGVSASMNDLGVKVGGEGITLLDHAGVDAYWYPHLKLSGDMEIDILDCITGSGYVKLEQKDDNSIFWEGFATAGIQIPNKIPLIGGMNIASADLGVNSQMLWGAVHILRIDAGVTYYWGGDVDFSFGKNNTPEATMQSLQDAPVYTDKKTGRTLYMHVVNRAKLSNSAAATSSDDKLTHTINLGIHGNKDGVLNFTFPASSQLEAETRAKKTTVTDTTLVWLDRSKPADDPANANANAMVTWDSASQTAKVTITFTDESQFNKDLTVTTDAPATMALYGFTRLPGLSGVTLNGNKATVKGDLTKLDSLTLYAADSTGKLYLLAQKGSSDLAATSSSITVDLNTDALPTGTYTIKAVGTTSDKSSNPVVEASGFTNTNLIQPEAPTVKAPKLGGDYSIDLPIAKQGACDGYRATVYEKTAGGNVATGFADQDFASDSTTLTVGGQYTTTVSVDADGKAVAPGTAGAKQVEKTLGLSAGKTYLIGVTAYKKLADGTILKSAEALSDPISMKAPEPLKVSLKAENAAVINDVDTVRSNSAVIDVTAAVGTLAKGTWSLDGGADAASTGGKINLSNLSEGKHLLTFRGENAGGDGVIAQYQFAVDATAPLLQISSPSGGGFFTDSVTVTGRSEPGAVITAAAESGAPQTVTAGEDGAFSLRVAMDSTLAYENIAVWAQDAAGNKSRTVTLQMTNSKLGDGSAELKLYLGNQDVTDKKLPDAASGQLTLKLQTAKTQFTVSGDTAAASSVNWKVSLLSGTANVDDNGKLTSSSGASGIVTASLSGLTAAAVLGNQQSSDQPAVIPTDPIHNIATPDSSSAAEILIGGEKASIATETKTGGTTTLTVDAEKFSALIAKAAGGTEIVLPIAQNTRAQARVSAKNLEELSQKGCKLVISTGAVRYELPAGAFSTAALCKTLGASDSAVTTCFTVTQNKSSDFSVKSGKLLMAPVSFQITGEAGGKSAAADTFAHYVDRVITLPAGTDTSSFATAVCLEAGGTERHVPTALQKKADGSSVAVIHSLTNSTYALISRQTHFADAAGQWYGIELVSDYLFSFFLILLHNRICRVPRRTALAAQGTAALFCLACVAYSALSAWLSVGTIRGFSMAVAAFKLAMAAYLLGTAVYAFGRQTSFVLPLLYGDLIYAMAYLWDRILPDFEPIAFGWFSQWGAVCVIAAVAAVLWNDWITAYRQSLTFAEENRQMQRQLHMQVEHYEQLQEKIQESRRIRHDFRQHLRVIASLAQENQNQKLLSYVAGITEQNESTSFVQLAENTELNAILQYYYTLAQKHGIDFRLRLELPAQLGVPVVALGAIVGNLLENAMEACLRQPEGTRYIRMAGRLESDRLVLVVDNSFDGALKRQNDRFLSRKHDGVGQGLESVRELVLQAGGTLRIHPEDAVFQVDLSLPIGQPENAG